MNLTQFAQTMQTWDKYLPIEFCFKQEAANKREYQGNLWAKIDAVGRLTLTQELQGIKVTYIDESYIISCLRGELGWSGNVFYQVLNICAMIVRDKRHDEILMLSEDSKYEQPRP